MRIKKYQGATMAEALKKVKHELGPEAVILNVNSSANPSRLVEVTAALDNGYSRRHLSPPAAVKASMPSPPQQRRHPLTEEAHNIIQEIQEIKEFIRSHAEYHWYDTLPKQLRQLAVSLRDNGVEASIVNGLIQWLLIELKGKEFENKALIREKTREVLEKTVVVRGGIKLRENGPTVVCLVGPAGSGKTTTVAKIAAEFAFSQQTAVSMVSADTKRVGALYQLRCYGEVLDIPFAAVYSPQQMQEVVRSNSARLIIVDTPAVNPLDKKELQELKELISPINPDEVYLLVSAVTGFKSAVETVNAFKMLPITGILFTKIDELSTPGSLLSVSVKSDMPGCYITNGRSVPGNIELLSSKNLAEWALKKYH